MLDFYLLHFHTRKSSPLQPYKGDTSSKNENWGEKRLNVSQMRGLEEREGGGV